MDKEETRAEILTHLVDVGQTVYIMSVHSTQMTTWYKVFVLAMNPYYTSADVVPFMLTRRIARLGGRYDKHRDALKSSGWGLSRSFAIVYDLGRMLWPDGFECIGKRALCPSNDHRNGVQYRKGLKHSDGGYALRMEQI